MQWAAGLLLLVGGADLLVRAAVSLAGRWRVRPLIIGLTMVAFGSSAPQLVVSLQAAFTGAPDIAVGSVFGSNVFNILMTLGLSALLVPLRVSRQVVRLDIPLMIAASLLVWLLSLNQQLGRLEGVLLLAGLAAYLYLIKRQAHHPIRPLPETLRASSKHTWALALTLLAGLGLLVAGGHLLLDAAIDVAQDYGLSDRIIGLTIVAVGTCMPELATSLIAALRGQRDMAVGNVIGSSLFNLLGVLGFTAVVAPEPLTISPNALTFDLPVMVAVAALCLPLFHSNYRLTRAEGLALIGLYLTYGAHVLAFSTGLALATRLEHWMLFYGLPVLAMTWVIARLRSWRRRQ
ncbi:calcium/sodium antiporter [Pseudomonas sp. dw_358]|uniref:calcium/sodium antiporter n=1 Tax=Pseudomonas sp. dw_358 TaxID=2720083 RepID=UPI001BD3C020|nr:calcium/sodium antiporter [Pseudomonas sp. dw_358]